MDFVKIEQGRFFTENEVRHRRNVVVLGQTPYKAFFENTDPIGKVVRIGTTELHDHRRRRPAPVDRRPGQRPGRASRFIPHTSFAKTFGAVSRGENRRVGRSVQIFARAPRRGEAARTRCARSKR